MTSSRNLCSPSWHTTMYTIPGSQLVWASFTTSLKNLYSTCWHVTIDNTDLWSRLVQASRLLSWRNYDHDWRSPVTLCMNVYCITLMCTSMSREHSFSIIKNCTPQNNWYLIWMDSTLKNKQICMLSILHHMYQDHFVRWRPIFLGPKPVRLRKNLRRYRSIHALT